MTSQLSPFLSFDEIASFHSQNNECAVNVSNKSPPVTINIPLIKREPCEIDYIINTPEKFPVADETLLIKTEPYCDIHDLDIAQNNLPITKQTAHLQTEPFNVNCLNTLSSLARNSDPVADCTPEIKKEPGDFETEAGADDCRVASDQCKIHVIDYKLATNVAIKRERENETISQFAEENKIQEDGVESFPGIENKVIKVECVHEGNRLQVNQPPPTAVPCFADLFEACQKRIETLKPPRVNSRLPSVLDVIKKCSREQSKRSQKGKRPSSRWKSAPRKVFWQCDWCKHKVFYTMGAYRIVQSYISTG